MRVGIDLGGTKTALRLFDEEGRAVVTRRVPTRAQDGYDAVLHDLVRMVRDAVGEQGMDVRDLQFVGLAAAGQIDRPTGAVLASPNLDWNNVPLKGDLERIMKIPVRVENDVNAATYGEWKFGMERRVNDLVGVFVGTGIGGGLILGGRLHRGFSGVGAEVGHITLNVGGYPCRCGNTGCFEAYCGGRYLVDRMRERMHQGERGMLWDLVGGHPETLHAGHIEEASEQGDAGCMAAWNEMIEYFGAGLQSLANLLNPQVILLGGGVVTGTRHLVDRAVSVMKRRAMPGTLHGLEVVKARLGEDAAALGVAFMDEDDA